jgi:hypothetical protein
LAEEGIELCLSKQSIFSPLKIHTVFLSPMKRVLETTYHVFKDHPDFETIKFVILPKLREQMNHSSGIPSNIIHNVEEFGKLFPNLDDSEFEQYEGKPVISNCYFAFNPC